MADRSLNLSTDYSHCLNELPRLSEVSYFCFILNSMNGEISTVGYCIQAAAAPQLPEIHWCCQTVTASERKQLPPGSVDFLNHFSQDGCLQGHPQLEVWGIHQEAIYGA